MSDLFAFPRPDLFQARKILCVQPHYDDNDIGAGGTLAALSAAGADLIYLTATDDLVGVVDPAITDEQAAAQLKQEQELAGEIIGVKEHYWLGYPDSGRYDYFDLRRDIIQYVRALRPDLLVTVDPWLPYEAHMDHTRVGRAVAEAAMLYNMLRMPSDPEVDARYEPYEILGVAFYFTHAPNTLVDITPYLDCKHRAVRCYQAQFKPEDTELLLQVLDAKERQFAEGQSFSHTEPVKALHPQQLHCGVDTWKS